MAEFSDSNSEVLRFSGPHVVSISPMPERTIDDGSGKGRIGN